MQTRFTLTISKALQITKKKDFNLYNQLDLSIQNRSVGILASPIGDIYNQCIYMFYLFLFWFSSIHLVMHGRGTKTIIDMSVFIAILKICNYFSKKKVGFPYCLINGKPNMQVKLVFLFTVLNMCFFFYIYISNLFLFLYKQTQIVGR